MVDIFDKFKTLPGQKQDLISLGHDPLGVEIDQLISPTQAIVGNRPIILAGTNNYLGLTYDENCIDAGKRALDEYGTGTTGSRIANGSYRLHRELEANLAAFLGKKYAMVFPTGYQANLGAIAGLCGPEDTILLDADSHACIYDGCVLSGAKTIVRFRHNSPDDLRKKLIRLGDKAKGSLIIVEGLYSMFGDIAPLAEFVDVKNEFGAYLYVDEAHSLGVYGERGSGVAEYSGVSGDVDFIAGTFSKSLGAIGGYAASDNDNFQYLKYMSRPYMFTASISPSTVASVHEALNQIRLRSDLRRKLWDNSHHLHEGLSNLGYELCAEASPIISCKMPNRETAVWAWNRLFENGVYVNLAIPPGTPNSTSLLRCSMSAAHEPEQIDIIIKAYASLAKDLLQLSQQQAAE